MRAVYNRIRKRFAPRGIFNMDPPMRNALRHYIQGEGIEIGALHLPLDLSHLAVREVKYVDYRPKDELSKLYEIEEELIVPIDILDDGETLETIPDVSLDFIIANHFIEHARDPIKTIENWLKKLRVGGVIFLTVPDQSASFDSERALTALEHLVEDYRSNPEQLAKRDRQHFEEWTRFVDKYPPDKVEARVKFLREIDYSIHFHTFTLSSFLKLIEYLRNELNFPLNIIACADTLPPGIEFVIVLQKN